MLTKELSALDVDLIASTLCDVIEHITVAPQMRADAAYALYILLRTDDDTQDCPA